MIRKFPGRPRSFWWDISNEELAHALHRATGPWLSFVLRATIVVLAATGIAAVVTRAMPVWWPYCAFAGVTVTALVLDGFGRSRLAGAVQSLGFWVVASVTVALLGGVRSPGTF